MQCAPKAKIIKADPWFDEVKVERNIQTPVLAVTLYIKLGDLSWFLCHRFSRRGALLPVSGPLPTVIAVSVSSFRFAVVAAASAVIVIAPVTPSPLFVKYTALF